jgi:type I restriction-modification system DNA methylase subunit
LLEHKTSYGETFFVPARARWHETWIKGTEEQGQDSNGTVWSICNMNMILHNITRFTIENGDTLTDEEDRGLILKKL